MKKQNLKLSQIKNLGFILILALSSIFYSCAPKKAPLRTVKQTSKNMINPVTTEASIKAGNTQSLQYDITVLERPNLDFSNNPVVTFEIKTPSNKFYTIQTNHPNNQDSSGFMDDTENGFKLDIRARCEEANCDKYTLLVTVVKAGYAIHQLIAVSYAQDCQFNLEVRNPEASNVQLFTSLDQVGQAYTISPRLDCPNGAQ